VSLFVQHNTTLLSLLSTSFVLFFDINFITEKEQKNSSVVAKGIYSMMVIGPDQSVLNIEI